MEKIFGLQKRHCDDELSRFEDDLRQRCVAVMGDR
jgi:hypothetical protein